MPSQIMSPAFARADGKINLEQVLAAFPSLGIPHFQRGLVWGDESVSLLLESLFFGTPCGTFILWKPTTPAEHGIGLVRDNRFDHLIIDGQQRMRSLYRALKSAPSESDGDDSSVEDDAVWCINLARVPELVGHVDDKLDKRPLFWKVKDPRSEGAHFKNNLIPLSVFTDATAGELAWDRITPEAKRLSVLARMKEIDLDDQVRAIWRREFFYLVMEESTEKNHMADVVQLYNRINSGGKRVESEERAFATLTSIWPGTSRWLHELFEEIHGEGAGREQRSLEGRDDLLRRKKERNFGFKLFIRAFLQACAYHRGYSVGSSSFSFDISARPDFQAVLAAPDNRAAVETIASQTREAIVEIRAALADLGCDALQTLPDTESLLPVLQVFIRFPSLLGSPTHRPWIRLLLLRLLLAELSTRELLALVKVVNRSTSLRDCAAALSEKIPPPGAWLEARLKDSNSLQDRYALLLYWLLRKRGARDFSYMNLEPSKRTRLSERGKVEALLSDDVSPEKQHIVPYSKLKDIFDIEDRGRLRTHDANNIGNLTYISHDLNHYDTGLGADAVDLELESEDNLRAHLLYEDKEDSGETSFRELYPRALEGKGAYRSFCKIRRKLTARAFISWHDELQSRVVEPMARVAPRAPLLMASPEGRVQAFNFSADLEDKLLELLGKGVKSREVRDAEVFEAEALGIGRVRFWADKAVIERPGPAWGEFDRLVRGNFSDVERGPDGTIVYKKPMTRERTEQLVDAMEAMAVVVRRDPVQRAARAQ